MYDIFDNFGVVSQALSYLVVRHAISDVPGAGSLLPADASVNFQNVTFRYPSGSFVLRDFNLYIKPQEKVGIVGVSGSGKSTVMRLLKREYEPTIGRILIGNKDISCCTLSSLAHTIVEVPQQVRLFNRSIRENIAYGRPDASNAEVWRAAEDVNCQDFIAHRADGISTEVGEDGVLLSGGERQRISIARAILKNAPILLLDEATSSLDPISEACVQRSLTRFMEGKTVIAIAHRLSTLRQMDRIVVMADGQIVEEGNHAQLLNRGHYYRRLWEGQSDQQVPAGSGDRT
jgi:ATP-binding cassette, subfamily B, bacterial